MRKGRRVHDWGQSGSTMALLANINRNPKKRKRAYPVSDFVPSDLRHMFRTRRGIGLTRGMLHALKPMFQKDK